MQSGINITDELLASNLAPLHMHARVEQLPAPRVTPRGDTKGLKTA